MTYESPEWCWPLRLLNNKAPSISDGFHPRGDMSVRGGLGHRGQDIMYRKLLPSPPKLPWSSLWYHIPPATPVIAANHGMVFRAGKLSTGHHVILDHGEHLGTGYYHLSELAPGIQEGAVVRMGQSLGIVGFNPIEYHLAHLHFDVAIAGHFIDASKYMRVWHYER